ncbi:signaling lymphocytic activation molecule-like [Pelobates fuscus]|uniref:signaling lymphocytic activation molecule-like n=1 Tax=Pelobates fuscus TaxID=191477 RepID=UPI002FE49F92
MFRSFCSICILISLSCFEVTMATGCDIDHVTINATSGVSLNIPAGKLENVEKIILKRNNGSTSTKLFSYDLQSKKPLLRNQRYSFYDLNGTVQFVDLREEDEGNYVLVKERGTHEEMCSFNIKVYGQIRNISINQSLVLVNDTCVVILNCTALAKDETTFYWSRDQEDLRHNSNILQIILTSDNVDSYYNCTAKNSVSKSSVTIKPFTGCKMPPEKNFDFFVVSVAVSLAVLGIILTFQIYKVVQRRHKTTGTFTLTPPERAPLPEPVEPPAAGFVTIYSKVQRTPVKNNIATGTERPRAEHMHRLDLLPGYHQPESNTLSTIYELAGHCERNGNLT